MPKQSGRTSCSKDWIILLEYSEIHYSLSMFKIEVYSLSEFPVLGLKRNTIRTWITELDWLLRNEVIKSFISRRFSLDNRVKILICYCERLNSPILSSNAESHLMERVSIILDNSNTLRLAVLEYTFKKPRSSSYFRFFRIWVIQHRFSGSMKIFFSIYDLDSRFFRNDS